MKRARTAAQKAAMKKWQAAGAAAKRKGKGGAKSKSISMNSFFKKAASRGFNPFSLITHIDGKPIKK